MRDLRFVVYSLSNILLDENMINCKKIFWKKKVIEVKELWRIGRELVGIYNKMVENLILIKRRD